MGQAFISRDGGRLRLEHDSGGATLIELWEPRKKGVLHTTFDHDGAIICQRLIKPGMGADEIASAFIKDSGIGSPEERPFEPVMLNRPCPTCGRGQLSRYAEAFSLEDAPVMPLYYCMGCKGKSFHMTDAYLRYLVYNNRGLFEGKELAELDGNSASFIKELHEYVIRIFASKKITQIK